MSVYGGHEEGAGTESVENLMRYPFSHASMPRQMERAVLPVPHAPYIISECFLSMNSRSRRDFLVRLC